MPKRETTKKLGSFSRRVLEDMAERAGTSIEEAEARLKKDVTALRKERKRNPFGLEPDEWKCIPDCDVCFGLGMVSTPTESGSRMVHCPNLPRIPDGEARALGVHPDDMSVGWGDVLALGKDVAEAMQGVRLTVTRGWGMNYLWGDSGRTKSMLLKAAITEWVKVHSQRVRFISASDLLDDLRLAYEEERPMHGIVDRLEYWVELDLLCIDEFEKVKRTDFAAERIDSLLNKRYEAAVHNEAATLLSGNQDPATLPAYLFDRLRDGRFAPEGRENGIYKLKGPSVRGALRNEDKSENIPV